MRRVLSAGLLFLGAAGASGGDRLGPVLDAVPDESASEEVWLGAIAAARDATAAARRNGGDALLEPLALRYLATERSLAEQTDAVRDARAALRAELLAALQESLGLPVLESGRFDRAAIERVLRLVAARAPAGARRLAFEPGDPRAALVFEIVAEQEAYLLGEAVPLIFRVTHEAAPYPGLPLRREIWRPSHLKKRPGSPVVSHGGDYRCSRPYRFKVLAIDTSGRPARDPDPLVTTCGGLVGGTRLDPGDVHDMPFELTDFCAIDEPGTYRVRVYHDLGWDRDDSWLFASFRNHPPLTPHLAPVVEATLTFVAPTEDEIKTYLAGLLGDPVSRDASWRKIYPKREAVEPVRHPVYLPELNRLARAGRWEAAAAIGQIPGVAALEALLDLNEVAPDVVREATSQLRKRMTPRNRGGRPDGAAAILAARDDLRDAANARFWKALNDRDRGHVIDAAHLYRVTGRPEEMEKFTGEFSRMLRVHQHEEEENEFYPRPAQVGGAMLEAGLALIDRGAEIGDDGYPREENTPAPELLRIAHASREPGYRPAGWIRDAEFLCTHPFPFVRSKGIELAAGPFAELPAADSARFVSLCIDALGATDLPTRVAAAKALGELKNQKAVEPLLATLSRPGDAWLLRAAYRAAGDCGGTLDRLTEVCVEALPSPGLESDFFQHVARAVTREPGGSGGRIFGRRTAVALRRHWRDILDAGDVRDRLRRGETLTPGVAPVTADAFPEGFHFRHDGRDWPPRD